MPTAIVNASDDMNTVKQSVDHGDGKAGKWVKGVYITEEEDGGVAGRNNSMNHHNINVVVEEVSGKEAVDNVIRGKSAYEMERARSAAALEGKRVAQAVESATHTPSLGGAIAPPTLNALSLKQWSHTKTAPGSKRLWQYFDFSSPGKLTKIWKTVKYKRALLDGCRQWVSEHGEFGGDWFRGQPLWQLTRLDTWDNYSYTTIESFLSKKKKQANMYFKDLLSFNEDHDDSRGDADDPAHHHVLLVDSKERYQHRAMVMHYAELMSPAEGGVVAPDDMQKLLLKLGKTHQAIALKAAAELMFPGHDVDVITDSNGYKAPIVRDQCLVFDLHGYFGAATTGGVFPPTQKDLTESLSKNWARLLL